MFIIDRKGKIGQIENGYIGNVEMGVFGLFLYCFFFKVYFICVNKLVFIFFGVCCEVYFFQYYVGIGI